jgi:hypothetical protein
MKDPNPFLKVRFDGKSVGAARIPVEHLLRFLGNFQKALLRSGMVMRGEEDSTRRGPRDKSAKDALGLDLVMLTEGSPSAVLGFERRTSDSDVFGEDFGAEVFESALKGLATIQNGGEEVPVESDAGVLMAWRDAGVLFQKGIDRIEFTLNHRRRPVVVEFTPSGFTNLQRRIRGPVSNIRTIEGRLLMADFKEHGTRCRIHPSVGEPVLCLFTEEQRDEILEDMLHYVKVIGEAKEDPITGRVTSIKIHDIERIEEKEDVSRDLLPSGSPIPRSFWESPSLDELAAEQGVGPLMDIEKLFGTWPGDVDDGFEDAIDALRHRAVEG